MSEYFTLCIIIGGKQINTASSQMGMKILEALAHKVVTALVSRDGVPGSNHSVTTYDRNEYPAFS